MNEISAFIYESSLVPPPMWGSRKKCATPPDHAVEIDFCCLQICDIL